MKERFIFILIFSFLITGCASTPVYKQIFKEEPLYNSKEFPVSKDILYRAAIKTICSKNFIIEQDDKETDFILAKRSFQKKKKTIILILQAKIVSDTENISTLYFNALQTTEKFFVADRTRFFMFLIPLPGGGGKEATKIKEAEKTIDDKEFYQNFFSAIEENIKYLCSLTIEKSNISPPQISSEDSNILPPQISSENLNISFPQISSEDSNIPSSDISSGNLSEKKSE